MSAYVQLSENIKSRFANLSWFHWSTGPQIDLSASLLQPFHGMLELCNYVHPKQAGRVFGCAAIWTVGMDNVSRLRNVYIIADESVNTDYVLRLSSENALRAILETERCDRFVCVWSVATSHTCVSMKYNLAFSRGLAVQSIYWLDKLSANEIVRLWRVTVYDSGLCDLFLRNYPVWSVINSQLSEVHANFFKAVCFNEKNLLPFTRQELTKSAMFNGYLAAASLDYTMQYINSVLIQEAITVRMRQQRRNLKSSSFFAFRPIDTATQFGNQGDTGIDVVGVAVRTTTPLCSFLQQRNGLCCMEPYESRGSQIYNSLNLPIRVRRQSMLLHAKHFQSSRLSGAAWLVDCIARDYNVFTLNRSYRLPSQCILQWLTVPILTRVVLACMPNQRWTKIPPSTSLRNVNNDGSLTTILRMLINHSVTYCVQKIAWQTIVSQTVALGESEQHLLIERENIDRVRNLALLHSYVDHKWLTHVLFPVRVDAMQSCLQYLFFFEYDDVEQMLNVYRLFIGLREDDRLSYYDFMSENLERAKELLLIDVGGGCDDSLYHLLVPM